MRQPVRTSSVRSARSSSRGQAQGGRCPAGSSVHHLTGEFPGAMSYVLWGPFSLGLGWSCFSWP